MGSQKGVENLFVSFRKPKSVLFSHKLLDFPESVENEKFCIIPGKSGKISPFSGTPKGKLPQTAHFAR